ncbi:MAG: hypothetical protein IPF93_08480 [Saprospiraceae bacterium]|nr:hypothetical protein [Saprospiraceae bacterium]
MNAFRAEKKDIPSGIRNSKHGSIELSNDKKEYLPTKERAELLEIKGGEKSISGKSINSGFEFQENLNRLIMFI